MSSWPGSTLENLIWDTWGRYQDFCKQLHPEILKRLVTFYEPYREELERRLNSYEEEESGSWRDFKYFVVWDDMPDPPESLWDGFTNIDGQWLKSNEREENV